MASKVMKREKLYKETSRKSGSASMKTAWRMEKYFSKRNEILNNHWEK